MNKYEKVINEWESIKPQKRNGRVAKLLAAKVGMRSMLEVYIADDLWYLQKEKKIKKFEYEPERWEYQHKPQHYTPDFRITLTDGTVEYYEVKGKMTNETRKKILSIIRCNPDKKLRIIFERAKNKIRAGSKTTYATWCDGIKIDWSEKEVPKSWVDCHNRSKN